MVTASQTHLIIFRERSRTFRDSSSNLKFHQFRLCNQARWTSFFCSCDLLAFVKGFLWVLQRHQHHGQAQVHLQDSVGHQGQEQVVTSWDLSGEAQHITGRVSNSLWCSSYHFLMSREHWTATSASGQISKFVNTQDLV